MLRLPGNSACRSQARILDVSDRERVEAHGLSGIDRDPDGLALIVQAVDDSCECHLYLAYLGVVVRIEIKADRSLSESEPLRL